MANTKFKVVLGISFLKINNTNIAFGEETLTWKSYTTKKALPTTERVKLVDPKEFVIVALDADSKTFVEHVAIREQEKMLMHSEKQAQIEAETHINAKGQSGAQVGSLIFNKAPTKVPAEYSNYSNVFSAKIAAELPENTRINEHPIELEEGKQPSFRPIYSLSPVEWETLKTYIETNLANGFIRPSKSPAGAPIFFDQKPDGSLRLCVDYQGLNNIIIKNQYLLPLIGELLDQLGRARRFTQLDLTNAYHWMRIRESDKWKTVFRTWYGHFKYQVMLFGFSNAPATFQRYVNKILVEKLDIFVIVNLDDIFIYTKDPGQPHVEAVRWVLDKLRKYSFFSNLKKCRFHQDVVRFLEYVMKDWPELKSVQDIQVFLGFANFYRQFIQGFSRIAALFTSILKTTSKPALSRNNGSRSVSNKIDDNKPAFGRNDGDGEIDGIVGDNVEYAKKSGKAKGQKSAKFRKLSKSKKSKGEISKKPPKSENSPNFDTKSTGPSFLTPEPRSAFNHLRLAITKALIFWDFDPEYHIQIKIDASSYAIGSVPS